jgi:hypothetical protein
VNILARGGLSHREGANLRFDTAKPWGVAVTDVDDPHT